MTESIQIAIISGLCVAVPSLVGTIVTAVINNSANKKQNEATAKKSDENTKLTIYRIEQLEDKVNKHNSVVERTFKLEGRMTEVEHDVRDLKSAK